MLAAFLNIEKYFVKLNGILFSTKTATNLSCSKITLLFLSETINKQDHCVSLKKTNYQIKQENNTL